MKSSAKLVEYRPGDHLFVQGDPGKEVYVLQSGVVEITRDGENIAYITERGAYIGEMAFLLRQPRNATAMATETTEAVVISESNLDETIKTDPALAIKLARTLAWRLEALDQSYLELLKTQAKVHKVDSIEEFVEGLPYSKLETFLTDAVRHKIFHRDSALGQHEAEIRYKHFMDDLVDMRAKRDLYKDPLTKLAAQYDAEHEYRERLRRAFGEVR